MNDPADMADGVAEIAAAGASFAPRGAACRLAAASLQACACGGRPAYRPSGEGERLACRSCGRGVGPMPSRQALASAWSAERAAEGGAR